MGEICLACSFCAMQSITKCLAGSDFDLEQRFFCQNSLFSMPVEPLIRLNVYVDIWPELLKDRGYLTTCICTDFKRKQNIVPLLVLSVNTSYDKSLEGSFIYPRAYPISYWNRLFYIQLDLRSSFIFGQAYESILYKREWDHGRGLMTLPGFRILQRDPIHFLYIFLKLWWPIHI